MGKVFTITAGLENMGALKTGGQGSVYKGRRTGTIITAVKLLPTPIHSESPEDKHYTAFQNEVAKLRKVNEQPNPHVVRILSSGLTESGSFPFIEMEYVEGPDLEELLQPPHDPVFTLKEAIRVAEQLAHALAHCHRVGVKHGDMKSNNVKYNVQTGNYVLLDFGMAIMSDEQRRTSLRHAGAIEFMAPEQNDGQILFQTDVYSFGIILFELLAGTVPFPLRDRGETARTQIMLAHMETVPPDLLALRRAALPAGWDGEKREREAAVPQWLLDTIYICLEKRPERRFRDGVMLHEHIVLRSTHRSPLEALPAADAVRERLEEQNRRLQAENDQLRAELERVRRPRKEELASEQPVYFPRTRRSGAGRWLSVLLVVGVLGVAAWLVLKKPGIAPETQLAQTEPGKEGRYLVKSARAYFHDQPNAATRRNAFMVPSEEVVKTTDEKDGFVYADFTNDRGQRSKGWLRKSDLLTEEEWVARRKQAPEKPKPSVQEIRSQLAQARRLMADGQVQEALFLYQYLSELGVAEAMYEYGNLALQRQHNALDCGRAWSLVKAAADRNHPPAKRTLGFLYIFADNPEVLRLNNYEGCSYERNVYRGSRLLLEAVAAGDTTALRLSEELQLEETSEGGTP